MSVPVQEAAAALVPFLAAGADAAARDLAGQAGSSFSKAALRLIARLKGSLKGPAPDAAEVEEALRKGLDDGTVSPAEIRALVSLQSSGRDSWNINAPITAGRDVNLGTTQHFEGDGEA